MMEGDYKWLLKWRVIIYRSGLVLEKLNIDNIISNRGVGDIF